MKTEKAKYRITFTEPTLATSPGNKELLEEFKASKAPTVANGQEEIANTPESIEKASTVFPRDERGLFAWDYQLKGYFKEALAVLIELGDSDISKWQCKKAIDMFMFVGPRRVYYRRDGATISKPDGDLQRPLRATTMQGDRICLARSEMLNEGVCMEFEITCQITENAKAKIAKIDLELIEQCLDRGQFTGFSQWRGASFGRFTWEKIG